MAKVLTGPGPAVAVKAQRLVQAARKASFDPFVEIDWDVPFDDDQGYYLPPEELPLFGTPAWDAMRSPQRVAYSRHECASLCAAGIWFENILMQLVLRQLYDLPADDPSHRFLLLETAEECRHSSMFGEFVRRAGTPAYEVPRPLRLAGRLLVATASRAEAFIAILAAEEMLDASNRRTMHDGRVHPVSRSMARIHVAEEARHLSYARTYVDEIWPETGALLRARARLRAPLAVAGIAAALTNPGVYRTVGVPGGWRSARTNPHHRRRVAADLVRLTTMLEEADVITPATRPVWRRLGLVA